MRLNGKGCRSKTILNGNPLYNYDMAKQQQKIKHNFMHKKIVKSQRKRVDIGRWFNTDQLSDSQLKSTIAAIIVFLLSCLIASL